MLAFITNFYKIRFQTNNISKTVLIFIWKYDLMCPSMTSEVIHHKIILAFISIRISYKWMCSNFFFNSRNDIITSLGTDGLFFVRCRGTYVLYKYLQSKSIISKVWGILHCSIFKAYICLATMVHKTTADIIVNRHNYFKFKKK